MNHEDEYEDDWMAEAPTLASLDKNVDFEVPEGYFEELPSHVMARIQAMSQAEAVPEAVPAPTLEVSVPRPSGLRRSLFWSAAAGIALLLAVGTYYVTRGPASAPVTFADADADAEAAAQLAAIAPGDLIEGLDGTAVNDEELFAMLGDDATSAFEDQEHQVQSDEALEYLQNVDLDDLDLQGLDIDLKDLD